MKKHFINIITINSLLFLPSQYIGHFPDECRHPHIHRRQACHCPQQNHDYRQGDCGHRVIQFYKGRRGEERGKPPDHFVEGTGKNISR